MQKNSQIDWNTWYLNESIGKRGEWMDSEECSSG